MNQKLFAVGFLLLLAVSFSLNLASAYSQYYWPGTPESLDERIPCQCQPRSPWYVNVICDLYNTVFDNYGICIWGSLG